MDSEDNYVAEFGCFPKNKLYPPNMAFLEHSCLGESDLCHDLNKSLHVNGEFPLLILS